MGPLRSRHSENAARPGAQRASNHAGRHTLSRAYGMMLMASPARLTASEAARGEHFVKLEKVTLTYGQGERSVHALDETDLAIDKGDFVALVGPSGCGKSTILKLVTGLIR